MGERIKSAKAFIMHNPNTYGSPTSDHKVVLTVGADIVVSIVDELPLYRTLPWFS